MTFWYKNSNHQYITSHLWKFYQYYENCQNNIDRFNIQKIVSKIKIPHLIVHGSEDKTVSVDEAFLIKKWNNNSELIIIEGADHVMGGFHPYNLENFPDNLNNAIQATIDFLKY